MSRIPAKDARQKFLEGPDLLDRGNVMDAYAMSFLRDEDALHQALRRASGGCGSFEILRQQVEQHLTHWQQMAGKRLSAVAVYRKESNATAIHRRRLAAILDMASLDRIRWQFRVQVTAVCNPCKTLPLLNAFRWFFELD